MANNLIIGVAGLAGNGKSTALEAIPNQNEWLYVNCETNKPLPFKHNFIERVITNPKELKKVVQSGAGNAKCKGIIIDTFTSALDMMEMKAKKDATDKYQVWDMYRDFILDLFQGGIAACNKPIILLCHVAMTKDIKGRSKLAIAVKGSMADRGIESFFTNIVYADCVDIDELEEFQNDMLSITEDEKEDGTKYVFQTRKLQGGAGINIRATKDMWPRNKGYIDNNIMHVIKTIKNHYGDK